MVQTVNSPATASPAYQRARQEAARLMDYPDYWLMTPNSQLGFQRPDDLMEKHGAAGEKLVMDLLAAIREGFFS